MKLWFANNFNNTKINTIGVHYLLFIKNNILLKNTNQLNFDINKVENNNFLKTISFRFSSTSTGNCPTVLIPPLLYY